MVLPRAYGRTVQEEEAAEQESSPRSSFTSSQRTLLTRKQETLVPSTPVGLAWHSSLLCAALDSRRAGETCLALLSYTELGPCWGSGSLLAATAHGQTLPSVHTSSQQRLALLSVMFTVEYI